MTYLKILECKKPTLIASLPGNRVDLARAAWECGADVVKVHMNVEHRASGLHFGSFEEEESVLKEIIATAKGPCGFVAGGDIASATLDYLKAYNLGFEFVSLYASTMALEVLAHPSLVKMVALAYGYTLTDAKHLAKVGGNVLEASILDPATYGQPLTAKELIEYSALCEASELPVVIPTQRNIKPAEVKQLAQCNVAGVMIGSIVTTNEIEAFKRATTAFRNEIDKI